MLRHVSLMSCCCPSSDVAAIVLRVLEFKDLSSLQCIAFW